jgi:non-homologous end joining protein Ku
MKELAPYLLAFAVFLVVAFLFSDKKMKGLANAILAFRAKWVEIKEAEKAGTPPPKMHGLTVSGTDEVRASDIQQAIKDAQKKRRHSKEKP